MALLRWVGRVILLSGVFLLSGMQAAVAIPLVHDNELKLEKKAGSGNEFFLTLSGEFDSFGGAIGFLTLNNLAVVSANPLAGLNSNPDNVVFDPQQPDMFVLTPFIDGLVGPSGPLDLVTFVVSLIDTAQRGFISLDGFYDYGVEFGESPDGAPNSALGTSYTRDFAFLESISLRTPGEVPEAPVMLTFATGLALLAWARRRAAMRS